MIDVEQKKEKILLFLEKTGPSLPVRIAKTIEMDPVFASAILSELLNIKKVKVSYMKIGASPLYLLPGQEKKLELYSDNLKSGEKEAYLKLKEEKVLKDEEEEPLIRVALRNIKDFAIPFEFKDKIIWRYTFSQKEEIQKILGNENKKNIIKEKIKFPKKKVEGIIKDREKIKKIGDIFKEDEDEEKPEFLNEVKNFLKKESIEFLEEIKTGKKEIVARVNLKTNIGDINFILVAKNKLTTNKEEINSALQLSRYNKMPCLFLIKKEPVGSVKKILEENNLIKLKVIKD
tara:strand:- start:3744 stop:4610 length:867 start_codon:yes stop_codon:yes gene_type:complete